MKSKAKRPQPGRTLRVEVTAADIKKGVRSLSWRCPIARALRRALKCRDVLAGEDICELLRDGATIKTPPAARRFIHDFDAGRPVAPFTFTISPFTFTIRRP